MKLIPVEKTIYVSYFSDYKYDFFFPHLRDLWSKKDFPW